MIARPSSSYDDFVQGMARIRAARRLSLADTIPPQQADQPDRYPDLDVELTGRPSSVEDEKPSRSLDTIIAELNELRLGTMRRAPQPTPKRGVRPPVIEATATHESEPLLLPICGPDIGVTTSASLAVLQFKTLKDDRPVLIPIGASDLLALAGAVAAALVATMDGDRDC